MSYSNYMENWVLNQLMTSKTIYVGYGTAASETSLTEPVGNGYARKALGSYTITSVGQDEQNVSNDADITFDESTGNQGTITHVGFFDALTSGNFLGSVSFAELGQDNVNCIAGTTIKLPAGEFKIRMT